MPIIDSHVHVWAHDPRFAWAPETAVPPEWDASPERLLAVMRETAVSAAVLVQYIGYRWNNAYVAAALAVHPDRFMGVCRVDPEDPAAPDQLSYWTETHGFHGVRISPEADRRGDWFGGPLIRPLLRRASKLGIPVLVLTKPSRLPELLGHLEHVPDLDIVLDHFADCDLGEASHRESLALLARHPRVFLKTGHVWSNSRGTYPWRDQHALLKHGCELFGADRVMWGSDWSFCLRHASYRQSLAYLTDEPSFLTPQELDCVLGGTALRLWRFDQAAAAGWRNGAAALAAGSE